MERRNLVVKRLDKNGEFHYYATFFNSFSGKYNLTTLLMQFHGCKNWWDKKLREKYEKEIWTGSSGMFVYFDFGTDVYSCLA